MYDEIYVVGRESPIILVYKAQEPFIPLADVVIEEMKRPWDIAACWIARCLYVCDREERCVWRVKICFDGSEMLVDKFIERVDAWSISVLTDGHVAVVADREDSGISVYSPHSEITTVIDLKGNELRHAMDAVRTSTGSWLVATVPSSSFPAVPSRTSTSTVFTN